MNEFSGPATLSISKVAFVERQIQDRKPHFVGISEVKNKGGRGNAEGETELLELLNEVSENDVGPFGYLSVKFPDEYLIHGWDTNKYIIEGSTGQRDGRNKIRFEHGEPDPEHESPWGYGHRYIWTRLVSRDKTKKFLLVTCHMPGTASGQSMIEESWNELMAFLGRNKGVPILLMGDTNKSWGGRPISSLQHVLGENPYPHLALKQGDEPTTIRLRHIDNFIFF